MKNFFIIFCCLYLTKISAQHSITSLTSTSNILTENYNASDESATYTKLTGENCSTEAGFGLSDCGFAELNQFMTNMTYPNIAYENNIQDKCTISFTGTKEGKTQNIKVTDCASSTISQKSVEEHLSKMIWQPVYKNDKPIDFTVTFNTVFKTEL